MFTVYHINSTMEKKTYKREDHARALVAKLNANARRTIGDIAEGRFPVEYAYAARDVYLDSIVYMVERTNMRSGKKYFEPSNTPCYMSPACESYWSM